MDVFPLEAFSFEFAFEYSTVCRGWGVEWAVVERLSIFFSFVTNNQKEISQPLDRLDF